MNVLLLPRWMAFLVQRTPSAVITRTNCPQINKGDMLHAYHPLIHIDEAAFGPTARQFNPRRFIENPELKKKVN